jgi:hypothetical protein
LYSEISKELIHAFEMDRPNASFWVFGSLLRH